MNEDEYLAGEPNENEDDSEEIEGEFGDTFLAGEEADGDVNVILIPKFDYDYEQVLRSYVKVLKKCSSSDEAYGVLLDLVQQIKIVHEIEKEADEIRDRVEGLKYLMEQVSFV